MAINQIDWGHGPPYTLHHQQWRTSPKKCYLSAVSGSSSVIPPGSTACKVFHAECSSAAAWNSGLVRRIKKQKEFTYHLNCLYLRTNELSYSDSIVLVMLWNTDSWNRAFASVMKNRAHSPWDSHPIAGPASLPGDAEGRGWSMGWRFPPVGISQTAWYWETYSQHLVHPSLMLWHRF